MIMMMPSRLTSLPNSSFILFWITIISIIVQASLLPLADEETDKRTGHNIMRFGRQAGHNILRFGRTPGHNIMRFGKREESNSVPGSSYEMLSEPKSNSYNSDYQSNNGFDFSPYLPSPPELYGQPSPLNAALPSYISQRSMSIPYQQAKKGRPETDHVIMRFG